MTDKSNIQWLPQPEDKDYPAAQSYLEPVPSRDRGGESC